MSTLGFSAIPRDTVYTAATGASKGKGHVKYSRDFLKSMQTSHLSKASSNNKASAINASNVPSVTEPEVKTNSRITYPVLLLKSMQNSTKTRSNTMATATNALTKFSLAHSEAPVGSLKSEATETMVAQPIAVTGAADNKARVKYSSDLLKSMQIATLSKASSNTKMSSIKASTKPSSTEQEANNNSHVAYPVHLPNSMQDASLTKKHIITKKSAIDTSKIPSVTLPEALVGSPKSEVIHTMAPRSTASNGKQVTFAPAIIDESDKAVKIATNGSKGQLVKVSDDLRKLMLASLPAASLTNQPSTVQLDPEKNFKYFDGEAISSIDPTRPSKGFVDLPDELLLEMLKPLLVHPHPMPVTARWEPQVCATGHVDHHFLHTCMDMYRIALPLYYSLNTFSVALRDFQYYPFTHARDFWPHRTGQSNAVYYCRSVIFHVRPLFNWQHLQQCLDAFRGGDLSRIVLDIRNHAQTAGENWVTKPGVEAKWDMGWEVHHARKKLANMVREMVGPNRRGVEIWVGVGGMVGWKEEESRGCGWYGELSLTAELETHMGRVVGTGTWAA